MYRLKRIFEYARFFIVLIAAEIASVFVRSNPLYKDLWIVSERGLDARDNGYHFFKYITREHPEINSAYIISEDSPDREKVASLGRVISYGSFRHYLSYLLAKVRVSSHIDGYAPDILFFNKNKFGKFIPNKSKNVFLQHGIIKDDIEFCHEDNTNIDMFVCSAVPEFEYVEKTYGYKKGIIQLTGLCRYDNLRKNEKPTHKILFMPTWRSSLRTCSRHTFLSSEYFKRYNSFLNSKKLAELLDKYDYELIFYPHYEVQRFLDCFGTDNKRVKIADFKNNDVQQLLIDSDILVTDYSSVYFDYGYMQKPMVFYQFDEQAFRAQQYKKGYYDEKRDGFGNVVETEDEVIAELYHILENGLKPDDIYLKRMTSFYKFSDKNNCKRNFEAVCKLL
ncbi:MAG: CDP-glycerol glycerophosphotransferase family protein [Clostridia bacterium]|nr:CDP-glycerol glycerophosphotransferase family protein [Clostridia bacterium]